MALRSGYVREFVEVAYDVGLDGARIAELFGTTQAVPALQFGYRIDSEADQPELRALLADLLAEQAECLGVVRKSEISVITRIEDSRTT